MSAGAAFAGFEVLGSVLGGIGQQRELNAQAAALDENARLTLLAGEQEIAGTYRDVRQVSGIAAAALAESGAAMGTGTAADLLRESAFQAEIEVAAIRGQAQGQAANLRTQAAQARYAGGTALIEGVMGGLSAGLSYAMQSENAKRLDLQRANEKWANRLEPRSGIASPKFSRVPISAQSNADISAQIRRLGVLNLPGMY